jgi:hypothetical protein
LVIVRFILELGLMAYKICFELIVGEKEAYFVKEYGIDVAKICTQAIAEEIIRETDVRKLTTLKTPDQEINDLKVALKFMRQQRDDAQAALIQKSTMGLLQRIRGKA